MSRPGLAVYWEDASAGQLDNARRELALGKRWEAAHVLDSATFCLEQWQKIECPPALAALAEQALALADDLDPQAGQSLLTDFLDDMNFTKRLDALGAGASGQGR